MEPRLGPYVLRQLPHRPLCVQCGYGGWPLTPWNDNYIQLVNPREYTFPAGHMTPRLNWSVREQGAPR